MWLKTLQIIVFLLIINSCAHQVPLKPVFVKKNPDQIVGYFLDNLKQNCFTSSGKGKVETGEKSYSFGYDSVVSFDKGQWGIGFNVPFSGEETLLFEWDKNDKNKTKLRGTFYDTILSEILKMPKEEATESILRLRNLKDLQAQFFYYFEKIITSGEVICGVSDSDDFTATGECYEFNGAEKKNAFSWKYNQRDIQITIKNRFGYVYELKLGNVNENGKFLSVEIGLIKDKETKLSLIASTCR
ncbi:MAG: hypothetical protein U0T83_00810 [Bacteriovoracaceae bacterium]